MKKLLTIITLFIAIATGAVAQSCSSEDIANFNKAFPYFKKQAAAGDQESIENIVTAYKSYLCANYMGEPSWKKIPVTKYFTEAKVIEYAQTCVEESKTCQEFLLNLKLYKTAEREATALIAKYGLKAYRSIRKGKVYGGMPAALLTGYKTIESDGSRYSFYYYEGSYVDYIGSYKKYVPNNVLALMNSLGNVCPSVIKVRNGKVANIIY